MFLYALNITTVLGSIAYGGTIPIVLFMVLDIITGLLVAWKCEEVSSNAMTTGLKKKGGLVIALAIGYLLDALLMGGAPLFKPAIVTFILANEGLSLIENLGKLGVPIPQVLKSKLKALKGYDGYKDSPTPIHSYQDGSKVCYHKNFHTEGLCGSCKYKPLCQKRASGAKLSREEFEQFSIEDLYDLDFPPTWQPLEVLEWMNENVEG